MYAHHKVAVVIPAAGSGSRMGTKEVKTFLKLRGKELLAWTLGALAGCGWADQIVVVGREADEARIRGLFKELADEWDSDLGSQVEMGWETGAVKPPKLAFVTGGQDRAESVYRGLQAVDADASLVVVHDGARPLVSKAVIERGLEDALKYKASVVGVPVKDTVKVVDDSHFVADTPDRSRLFSVQTPQTFDYGLLMAAYAKGVASEIGVTDDSGMVEAYGHPVKMTLGSYDNIKVTTPEDLHLAERLLENMEAEESACV